MQRKKLGEEGYVGGRGKGTTGEQHREVQEVLYSPRQPP